jgi:hypothetical protein
MNATMKKKSLLYGVVGLAIVGFGFMLNGIITPDMYRCTDPAQIVGYVYVHDDDAKVGRQHIVQGDFWSFDRRDPIERVRLRIFVPGQGEAGFLPLAKSPGCSRWVGAVGRKQRGKVLDDFTGKEIPILGRYLYTVEIHTRSGRVVVLKPKRNWFEKLMGWAKEKKFKLTFEGEVSRFWLITHIALMVAAPVFLLHAIIYALLILAGVGDPLPKLKASLLWGWGCFAISAIPIGIVVTRQAFAVGFEPWPFGGDVTDSKSLFLVLMWMAVYLGCRKAGERTWAVSTLVATLVSAAVFLVPHSQIVQ